MKINAYHLLKTKDNKRNRFQTFEYVFKLDAIHQSEQKQLIKDL